MRKSCLIIGAAYSIGGAHIGNRRAPFFFRYHAKLPIQWHKIYWQDSTTLQSYPNLLSSIKRTNRQLIHKICQIRSHFKPIILGGDHSCAIATWQAVSSKPLGLLWIDAHFDSHIPETSLSHRLHGMPLAILLNQGASGLYERNNQVLHKQHTVIFGVHSFELAEIKLLTQLGIRYYLMSEIHLRGFYQCFDEAWRLVSSAPHGFGVSLDLDSIDPSQMPAVSVRATQGLAFNHLLTAIKKQKKHQLKAIEIAEFNPYHQFHGNNVKKISQLILALAK